MPDVLPIEMEFDLDDGDLVFRSYITSQPAQGHIFLFLAKLNKDNKVSFNMINFYRKNKKIETKYIKKDKIVDIDTYFKIVKDFEKEIQLIDSKITLENIPPIFIYGTVVSNYEEKSSDKKSSIRRATREEVKDLVNSLKSSITSLSGIDVDDLLSELDNLEDPSDNLKRFL